MKSQPVVHYFGCNKNLLLTAPYRSMESALNFAINVTQFSRIPASVYLDGKPVFDAANPQPVVLRHSAQ